MEQNDKQLDMLSSSYQRMADSLKRIADNVEQHGRALMGYIDKESNKLTPGLLQRTADIENILKNVRYWKRQWWSILRDVGIGIISAVILFRAFHIGG